MKLVSAEYIIDQDNIVINEGDLFCKVELDITPVICLWTGRDLINLSNFSSDGRTLNDLKYLIEKGKIFKLPKGTKITLEQE